MPGGPRYTITSLQVMAKMVSRALWPTPKGSDGEKGGPNQRDGAGNPYLPGAVQAGPGEQLSPCWVESLMGFPAGWTDIGGPIRRVRRITRNTTGSHPEPSAGDSPTAPDE